MSTADTWRQIARDAEVNATDYERGNAMVTAKGFAALWRMVARMSVQLAREIELHDTAQAQAARALTNAGAFPVVDQRAGQASAKQVNKGRR